MSPKHMNKIIYQKYDQKDIKLILNKKVLYPWEGMFHFI